MSSRSPRAKRRVHIWIYEDDWDRLKTHYEHNVGVSAAVCTILHSFLDNVEAKAAQSSRAVPVGEELVPIPEPTA